MKITGVKTYVLQGMIEDQSFGWSQRVTRTRQSVLCEVSTDEKITGVGEAFYFGGPAKIAANIISDVYGPLLMDKDPLDTSVIWDSLYNWTRDQGMKGVTISALSAIDIALWDIKGKAQGLPIFKLLGGAYRHKARAYATGLYEPQNVPNVIEALVNEAVGYKEEGFSGMKLKVGYGIDKDVSYVKAIRQAIGEEICLMVDANHAYNSSEAIQLAQKLERFDVYWFEEPVPPEDLEGYCEVRKKSNILIAGGECEYTRYGFRNLINLRAVDILQPDLCAAGGFTEIMKIVAMASAANIPLIPHVWGTNVGLAASLQLFANLPHFPERRFPAEPFFEYDRSAHPFREEVTLEKFVMKNGYLDIPERPGLGINLNLKFVEKHAL
ncbi:MAG: mandelate racemase/muconate lactonizing enzyme family protein [Desulfobacterales bacterium]|nr:MAG: mandelate racemase/muconate lactonizing enzyme family protein [Desulfobacterales bacterium]